MTLEAEEMLARSLQEVYMYTYMYTRGSSLRLLLLLLLAPESASLKTCVLSSMAIPCSWTA